LQRTFFQGVFGEASSARPLEVANWPILGVREGFSIASIASTAAVAVVVAATIVVAAVVDGGLTIPLLDASRGAPAPSNNTRMGALVAHQLRHEVNHGVHGRDSA
jgi:hypothetical protein